MGKSKSVDAGRALARTLAQEAIVLLKNDGEILPLPKGKALAVFGRSQNDTIIGGSGSGASDATNALQMGEELEKAGFCLQKGVKAYYREECEKELTESAKADAPKTGMDFAGLVASGLIYEIFGCYHGPVEEPIPAVELLSEAASETDTAIFVIGRASGGEECDRRVEEDYYLTASEKELVQLIHTYFDNIIVIYNVNGAVDTGWMREYPRVKAAVFMGTSGEQAAGALADILAGVVSPSGKLSQTFALAYEDYPTAEHFSYDKSAKGVIKTYEDYGLSAGDNGSEGYAFSPVTVYAEDIYVGYRYFDSFRKEVAYPFGFGLSYAAFELCCAEASVEAEKVCLEICVCNVSKKYAGKETVQIYVSIPDGKEGHPAKELKAFTKTGLLQPGEKETVKIYVPIQELLTFSEEECAYILERGVYRFWVGNSADNVTCVATVTVPWEQIVQKVKTDIGVAEVNRDKIEFLSRRRDKVDGQTGSVFTFFFDQKLGETDQTADKRTFEDICPEQMSVGELAVLCTGYGPGLPFGGIGQNIPGTINYEDGEPIGSNTHPAGGNGYVSPALTKYNIHSTWYKDGPAGVGGISWPTGMMLACTFNMELLYEFGSACGKEAEEMGVDSWLAPALNLIRNPIEGRAFEYFSEDPYLTGACGSAVAKGAMENNHITVCPKHFALNEQETYRRGSTKKNIDAVDTVATARAIRELYLKPFQMVITDAKPQTIMTSFNKINGTFAAGHYGLCTEILRGEWGYEGVVITDWGDMDFVVDGADAVAAGNDVIMPGGPPVIKQILTGYEEGRVTLEELRTAAGRLLEYVKKTKSQQETI